VGCYVTSVDARSYLILAFGVALILSFGVAIFINSLTRNIRYEVSLNGEMQLQDICNELSKLGFEPAVNKNSIKYRGFAWFSLRDKKVKVRQRQDNTIVIKGTRKDVKFVLTKIAH